MKNTIICCGFGVQVSRVRTEEEPGFVVKIPKLKCRIYGGWNWGPHNPKEPSVIETLLGAKEVLIGCFNEYIYDFDKDNDYNDAIKEIDYALSDLLGKRSIESNRTFFKKCSFTLNGNSYNCIHKVKFRELQSWNEDDINVQNSIEWYKESIDEHKNGTLKQVFEFDSMSVEQWRKFVNGRTSKELAIDIVSENA